jgi:hypothetical protein
MRPKLETDRKKCQVPPVRTGGYFEFRPESGCFAAHHCEVEAGEFLDLDQQGMKELDHTNAVHHVRCNLYKSDDRRIDDARHCEC